MNGQVSEVTNEELSRWIAEKLEAEPPSCSFTLDFPRPPRSPLGYWSLMYSYLTLHMMTRKATPRDMVNDPAMTVMLLERMIRLDCTRLVFRHWPDGCRLDLHFVDGRLIGIPAETVGRAVAEAAALTLGWGVAS